MTLPPDQQITRRRLLCAGATAFATTSLARPANAAVLPPITALALSPDGKHLLAGSQAGVTINRAEDLEPVSELSAGMDQIHDLVFSPDGHQLAVVGGDPGEVGLVSWFQWNDRRRLSPSRLSPSRLSRGRFGDDVCYSLAFSPSGEQVVVASADESAFVAAAGAERPELLFEQHSRSLLACCFLPDSATVVTAGRDQTLRAWNAVTGESIRTMHNHTSDVFSLRLRPATSGLPMIASASADRTVRFWQPTIGRMVRFIRLPVTPLDIAWTIDGQALLAACDDGKLRRIDPAKVQVTDTYEAVHGWAYAITIDAHQQRAYVGGPAGQVVAVTIAS